VGLSYGHGERDGFTVNDVTGHLLDSRSADFGKAQLLWVPSPQWEARAVAYGERARDGDYALNDLGELRRRRTTRPGTSKAAPIATSGRDPAHPA